MAAEAEACFPVLNQAREVTPFTGQPPPFLALPYTNAHHISTQLYPTGTTISIEIHRPLL